MAFRCLISCLCLCLMFLNLYSSVEPPSSPNNISSNKSVDDLPLVIHPLYFISNICKQQKQHLLKITTKYCSKHFQPSKSQEAQQRGKRVGWTVTV